MWDFRKTMYAMTQLAKTDLFVYKLLQRLRKDGADTWLILWSKTLQLLKRGVRRTETIMNDKHFFFN